MWGLKGREINKEPGVILVVPTLPTDIGRDPLVTGKQVMEIKHTLKEARSLTDPICPSGAVTEHWGRGQGELCKVSEEGAEGACAPQGHCCAGRC